MKSVKTWAIIILAVVVILLLIFPGSQEVDTKVWKDSLKASSERIATLQLDRARLFEKIKSDSLESIRRDSAYKSDIKIKERRISDLKANPTVIRIREEVPVIDTLILAYDSIINVQSARLYDVGKELTGLRQDLDQVRINFEAQLQEYSNTQEILVNTIEEQRKELKKQKRKATLYKITTVIAGVGGVLLGAQ